MEDKNSKQKEFWSGKGGDYWVVKQNEMDIMLNPLGEKALAKLDLKADSNVLDVGCGCGATTLEIAKVIDKHGELMIEMGYLDKNGKLKV